MWALTALALSADWLCTRVPPCTAERLQAAASAPARHTARLTRHHKSSGCGGQSLPRWPQGSSQRSPPRLRQIATVRPSQRHSASSVLAAPAANRSPARRPRQRYASPVAPGIHAHQCVYDCAPERCWLAACPAGSGRAGVRVDGCVRRGRRRRLQQHLRRLCLGPRAAHLAWHAAAGRVAGGHGRCDVQLPRHPRGHHQCAQRPPPPRAAEPAARPEANGGRRVPHGRRGGRGRGKRALWAGQGGASQCSRGGRRRD